MTYNMTYTYAVMDVSPSAYEEIKANLIAAGYDHALLNNGVLDMRGIGLQRQQGESPMGSSVTLPNIDTVVHRVNAARQQAHASHRDAKRSAAGGGSQQDAHTSQKSTLTVEDVTEVYEAIKAESADTVIWGN